MDNISKDQNETQPQEAKKTVQKLHFKLGERSTRFETPDGKVILNRLEGKTTGTVDNTMNVAWRMVQTALYRGVLTQTDKPEQNEEEAPIIDVTNHAEDKSKLRLDAAHYLRKMKKEQLIDALVRIKDPQLIAMMIEQESFGRNVSKRKRDDVIAALKERLEEVKQTMNAKQASMLAYTEVDDVKPVRYQPQS